MNPTIFISHRSTDKAIADMLVDFFLGTGIPRNAIFCSSLPGNDINEKISTEVKSALKTSGVNIAILSCDYYQSAFCLNEAGILWYQDGVPVIPIALPEIIPDNMYGFLNSEYKLRHLDSDTDISYIYDVVSKAVGAPKSTASIITVENDKLRDRYQTYLSRREVSSSDCIPNPVPELGITTDDERVALYYILKNKVRKVSRQTMVDWLHKNEIYDVNVDNAFDLLSSLGSGNITNDTLELGLDTFRQYTSDTAAILPGLEECVSQHIKLGADTFKALWESNPFDDTLILFLAYITEEKICAFGDRWMAEAQVHDIKQWESKNNLDSTLSENYGSCLQFFIQNDLVYESDWTSYGNPKEYSLCASLQTLLFNCPREYVERLQAIKHDHIIELPF